MAWLRMGNHQESRNDLSRDMPSSDMGPGKSHRQHVGESVRGRDCVRKTGEGVFLRTEQR